MPWTWQESYKAALLGKDPSNQPGRLMIAEKAILERLRQLPDTADELPESRALREALNSLYALTPHEHYPPGELTDDEEHHGADRKRLQIAAGIGVALFLFFVGGWVIPQKNQVNEALRLRAIEARASDPSPGIIAERIDNRPPAALTGDSPDGHSEDGLSKQPARNAPDSRVMAKNNGRSRDSNPRGTAAEPGAASLIAPWSEAADANAALFTENSLPQVPVDNSEAIAANPASQPQQDQLTQPGTSGQQPAESTPPFLAEEQKQSESASPIAAGAPDGAPPAAPAQDKSPVRRGSVSVSAGSYPAIRVPPELKAEAARSGASLQIGEPLSRVDPVYPEEAERQGIEGTVKLRAIIGKDGAVQDVQAIEGPPALATAAANAIRQWRYQPTMLDTQPVEVAQEFAIVFRLAKAAAAN